VRGCCCGIPFGCGVLSLVSLLVLLLTGLLTLPGGVRAQRGGTARAELRAATVAAVYIDDRGDTQNRVNTEQTQRVPPPR